MSDDFAPREIYSRLLHLEARTNRMVGQGHDLIRVETAKTNIHRALRSIISLMERGGTIPRMTRDQHDRVINRTASFVASQVELPSRSFVANGTNRLSSLPLLVDLAPENEVNGNLPRFDHNNIYMDNAPSMSNRSSITTGRTRFVKFIEAILT